MIAGGPSVLKDLPRLTIEPACVISANDHGFKQKQFKVDLIVNLDRTHCMLRVDMAKILRPYGVPIINRYSWADYRIPEWTLAGNSGLAAVAVAAALGADPVIVTGIDMFAGGRRYFHDSGNVPERQNRRRVGREQREAHLRKRMRSKSQPLAAFCKGANIRPMSGPLTDQFPKYDPFEVMPPRTPVAYHMKLAQAEVVRVMAGKNTRLWNTDIAKPGSEMAVTQSELNGDSRLSKSIVKL